MPFVFAAKEGMSLIVIGDSTELKSHRVVLVKPTILSASCYTYSL